MSALEALARPLLGLSEGDAAWVRILNVSVKES